MILSPNTIMSIKVHCVKEHLTLGKTLSIMLYITDMLCPTCEL